MHINRYTVFLFLRLLNNVDFLSKEKFKNIRKKWRNKENAGAKRSQMCSPGVKYLN